MNVRHMTGCRAWRRRLLAQVDGELPALEQLQFERHLDECPACEQALAFHLSIEQALHQSSGAEPDAGFEERMVAAVFERLEHSSPQNELPARSRRSRLPVAAATAALVLILARGNAPPAETDTHPAPSVAEAPHSRQAASLEAPPSLDPDRVIPARLNDARNTVFQALISAGDADDFAHEFRRLTAALSRDRWPLDELVTGAVDHPDPELANAAIRGVAELSFVSALPAVERATFRSTTAREALVTLGRLGGERYLSRLERELERPDRAAGALTGLAASGSARAARVLANTAALRPDQQQAALSALLAMGTPGIGELLRLKQDGFLAAADLLEDKQLPTRAQTLELLETSRDPELLRAALSGATSCGPDALPALLRLISSDALRAKALEAIAGIGGEPAIALLLGAPDLPEGARAEADRTVREILGAGPDGAGLAVRLARLPAGSRLSEALAEGGPELVACQQAILADQRALPDRRAAAAEWLAARGAVEPGSLLDLALEVALSCQIAAARLLCSAARAGASDADWSRLEPISKDLSKRILKRAEVIAARWEQDGLPPHPWELRRISKLIDDTLPAL